MRNHRNMESVREQGFTLIELVVVLAILGLLITVALPSYQQARQTAPRDEARTLGQEWRQLEYACFLTQGVTATCSNDTQIGFGESGANWDFATTTGAYTFATGTVTRCATAQANTTVSGNKYQLTLTVTGTGAGTGFDQFVGGTCP
ncbi:MAG TPA: type II secretion system protein [bacterium]|nr:type II secretion system protein [bacterium]